VKTSDSIAKIAEALAKAQGEITNPMKDRTAKITSPKGNYEYNYADLASVLDCVRPVLARHGIAVVQTPSVGPASVLGQGERGPIRVASLVMTTRLVHGSGEWMEADLSFDVDPDDRVQSLGSAITYLRRYALQAIVGIVAEEDDDGQGGRAQTNQRQVEQQHAMAPTTQPPPAPKPATNGNGRATKSPPAAAPPTPKQRYEAACEALEERLGSKPAHDLIMAIKAKHGGEHATDEQKLMVLVDLEKAVAS
jgi:hypothetical protein